MNENILRNYVTNRIDPLFGDYIVEDIEKYVSFEKCNGRIDLFLKHKRDKEAIIIELKYNNSNKKALTQLNKYFLIFISNINNKNLSIRRFLIDIEIPENIRYLCKKMGIEWIVINKKEVREWWQENKSKFNNKNKIEIDSNDNDSFLSSHLLSKYKNLSYLPHLYEGLILEYELKKEDLEFYKNKYPNHKKVKKLEKSINLYHKNFLKILKNE